MLERRLKALKLFGRKPMPDWGSDLSGIDFQNIKYFVRSTEAQAASWEDLPDDIKNTYDKLGIPEAEKQRLVSGVAAQYESEVVYHQIQEELEDQGVIFLDTDTALKEHPEIFQEYFGSVIPSGDNKFAALNTAVWSGGSFIYVPKGVHVEIPLQAYFRINTENMGQFERTLIIVDEGAYVHYVEGCTAPIYKSDSLHSAVVEIIVKKNARCRYTTIQNWSNNVYNLVTKRAIAHEGATMEWVDGNIGSKVTMKYPAVWMTGEHAKGEVLSIAFAGEGQHQDAGAKMVHAAPHTSSTIVVEVGRPRRWPHVLPRPGPDRRGRLRLQVDGEVRRAAGRHDQPLGHLPLRRRPRGRRLDGSRGDGLPRQRGPALLPDEPRHDRGRGHGHGRPRVRRADRPRAADGVRPRAQPAHRTADGRCRRLMSATTTRPPHHRLGRLAELFAPGVGAQAGPPTTPADGTGVAPGAHSHGGPAPTGSPAERFTSTDPDAFGVPTGREETWRFTPMKRVRALLDGAPSDAQPSWDADLPEGVELTTVEADDPLLKGLPEPADRLAALTRQHSRRRRPSSASPRRRSSTARSPCGLAGTGGRRRRLGPAGRRGRRVRQGDRRPRPHRSRASTPAASPSSSATARRSRSSPCRTGRPGAVHGGQYDAVVGRDATLQAGRGHPRRRPRPAGQQRAVRRPRRSADLFGVYFADETQHQEHRLWVDHAVPNCRSNVLYKGALQGEDARTVWIGDVRIRPAASAPTPTSSTATWCSPTAPAPTRCPTWRSRPARSSAPATPAPPAGSTTSSCSTSARAASTPRPRAGSSSAASSPTSSSRSACPSCRTG